LVLGSFLNTFVQTSPVLNIRLLSHKDIDPVKWDDSITRFFNGCVYAYSWYLDRICDNWMALVDEDFEAVMPLPITEIKGEKIIQQPSLVRYLGLFTNKLITEDLLLQYINLLSTEFLFVSLTLTKYNALNSVPDTFTISKSVFYSLDLMPNYTKLSCQYSRKALELIQSAHNQKIIVLGGLQPRELMTLLSKKSSKPSERYDEKNLRRLRSVVSHALFHNFGEIYGAYDVSNNLCAAAFFMGSHQKIYIPLYVQNGETQSLHGLYLVFDHFIKKNSEKNLVLNFEIPAHQKEKVNLFMDFGAKKTDLITLTRNKLPLWQRWMK
jgi:hypothetical protein